MTKKPNEMDIGERMVDYMPEAMAKLSAHICMVKICDKNHFCILDYCHDGDHHEIKHGVLCK